MEFHCPNVLMDSLIVGFEEVGFTGIKMLLDVRQWGLDGISFGVMARAKPNEAVEKEIWAEKSFSSISTLFFLATQVLNWWFIQSFWLVAL
jgi:hypothetical protein